MLNFTKFQTFFVYIIFLFLASFSFLNFQSDDQKLINKKKVNLGLDLQGGSYLLLEIDTDPLIKDRLQDKIIPIKKSLKENNIKFKDFFIEEKKIFFKTQDTKKFKNIFLSKKDNRSKSFHTKV